MMNLNDIWDCIDQANLVTETEERKNEIEIAIRNLQQLIDSGDARAWYPLGYAYYCHPNRLAAGSIEASETVRYLNIAIQHRVERALSHLYLAFHFFDIQDFERAKYYVDSVNENELEETMVINLHELKLCIKIQVEGIENSITAIREFSAYIESLTNPALPPLVLMNTLEAELASMPINELIRETIRSLDLAYSVLGENGFTRMLDHSN